MGSAEGARASLLALESPLALALMGLASAMVWLLLWRRSGMSYMLPLAAGWFGLCLYWSLLAVSAGPLPVVARAELAFWVRLLGLGAAGVMSAGKLLLLLHMWRNGKHPSITKDNKAI